MAGELSDSNRLLALSSSVFKGAGNDDGNDVLLVNSFSASESLSRMFRFDLEVMAETAKAPQVSAEKLIGRGVNIRLKLPDGGSRFFHGLVNQFVDVDQTETFRFYRLQVVPWLWLLTLNSDCRIFQKLTVPDILKQVFKPFGPIRPQLQRTYTPWDYRVQYRETHFNFVCRLMEQEGIFYFFEHEKDRHTLVLADTAQALPFGSFEKRMHFHPQATVAEQVEVAFSWQRSQQLDPGFYTLRDYHFEMPTKHLEGTEFGLFTVGGNDKFELYDYPGGYAAKFNDNSPERLEALGSEEPGAVSQIRMEEEETLHETFTAESNCTGLQVGFRVDLQDHPTMSGPYLVKSLQHSATQSHTTGQETGALYTNIIACMPFGRVFRPNRTSLRPVVQGPHTAVVVGSDNAEIFTDKFGRVKVQFPWDRLSNKDDKSSCWLRVAQVWSGTKWGGIFIPRVGQEVLVDFLEGDPDQPIVIGSLYNADNMPPYTLPDNQTQSGIKTRSSKDGSTTNFNEIRFEDKKDHEDLLIHAERTMHNSVEASQFITVGGDRHITTGGVDKDGNKLGDVKEKVFKNHNLHVLADSRAKVEGESHLHVMRKADETYDDEFVQNVTKKCVILADTIQLQGTTKIVLTAGSSSIVIDASGVTVLGSPLINLNSPGAPPLPEVIPLVVDPDDP
jgi:type VI secretion system secreted protein VgrG